MSRASTAGNPLERSGVFPICFLPLCKQHRKRGLGCCHLSSHSVPSAGSCCSHSPPHKHRDGKGPTAKSLGSGSPSRVLEQHFNEFSFFTAFNVQHKWNCVQPLSLLSVHPHTAMANPSCSHLQSSCKAAALIRAVCCHYCETPRG